MTRRRVRRGQHRRPASPRTSSRYTGPVSDSEFVARIRRHTPSTLVPEVARLGVEFAERSTWLTPGAVRPWVLAEIARVALVLGTEFNRRPAFRQDVIDCVNAYLAINDPDLHRKDPGAIGEFMLRIAGEQLTYQEEQFHDLARTAAIFTRTTPANGREPKIAKPGWDQLLFGCPLGDYLNTAFVLYAGAMSNGGSFDPAWLEQPQFEEIREKIPGPVLMKVMIEQFVADRDRLRAAQREAETRGGRPERAYRRFGFNPLSKHPVVSGLSERWYVPVPQLVLRKASALGVFYAGVERWGNAFADDIGPLFEAYIGNQLRELAADNLVPEIEYGPPKARQRSVDWIAVFPSCVLLVEAKSTRPTEPIRLGGPTAGEDLVRILAKGIGQLDNTANLIREGHESFRDFPADRPIIGLLATMEPFHTVNSPFVASALPDANIPWRVCSAEEIEALVRLGSDDAGRVLLDHMTDDGRVGHSIRSMLEGRPLGRSRILDEAWQSFSWEDPR